MLSNELQSLLENLYSGDILIQLDALSQIKKGSIVDDLIVNALWELMESSKTDEHLIEMIQETLVGLNRHGDGTGMPSSSQQPLTLSPLIPLDKALDPIVITSTPNLDGQIITDYLGLVTAEIFIPIRQIRGSVVRKEAVEKASRMIREQAFHLNATAIVHVKIDYTLVLNFVMVMMQGTAVSTKSEDNDDE